MTDTKRGAMKRALPYQFNDLFIDKNNFVYTTTGNTGEEDNAITSGQIKRMSPGGTNILDSDSIDFTDEGVNKRPQDIMGIEVDEDGFIYALDSVYGHIFVFDSECTMISCVGNGLGKGMQDGSFSKPTSLCVNGTDIVITDEQNRSITIFSLSEYGAMVKEAQTLTTNGYYAAAFPIWQNVLKEDSNSQIAYMGLGKGYYDSGEYKTAMEYSKIGCDRETYALAFAELRNDLLKKNFVWIVICLLVLIILIKILSAKFKKPQSLFDEEIKGKIKTYFSIIPHPADSFTRIKEKQHGSIAIAIIITILYYVTEVLKVTKGGFAFTYFDPSSYNSIYVLVKTSGLILLFTVAFWCVSTLFGGLGKLKDIFIVSSYSFTPIVFGNIAVTILSNVLVPEELGFINIFVAITIIYTGILLIFGLMIINDFEFGRFFGVTILAIIFMVILLFLIFVIVMLLQLLSGFAVTIVAETLKLFK